MSILASCWQDHVEKILVNFDEIMEYFNQKKQLQIVFAVCHENLKELNIIFQWLMPV